MTAATDTTTGTTTDTAGSPVAEPRELILLANATDVLGGVTAWTHQMARLFGAHGHRVQVVGIHEAELKLTLPEQPAYPVTALYPAHPPTPWRPRSPLAHFDLLARRREAVRVAGKRRAVAHLSEIFRAAGPGALVIVTQVWPMEWVLEADTTGLRLIGMSHESYEYSKRCHRFRWIKSSYPHVDRWLTLTQEDADAWIAEGFDNVGAMPNALGSLPERPSPRTGKNVASIGRLDDQKGIDLLLESWASVAGARPDWRLRIYGAGQDEAALKERCTALGLDGSVDWMGRTDDVAAALAECSVFVQSSRGEGFPLALMEAMASGVPCAAFDCAPGVREIVRDGEDGLLAPPGDTDALAGRLLRLTGNPRLRDTLGDRARLNVQRYSQDEILHRWHELFALLDR